MTSMASKKVDLNIRKYDFTNPGEKKILKCDIPPSLPVGESVQVSIAHVNSPNDFYVIRRDSQESLDKISYTLPMLMSFGAQEIFLPNRPQTRTSDVAVHNYAQNKWKRLKVLELLPEGNCIAVDIDWGGSEILPVENLRRPPDTIIEDVPPIAIHCTLDVEPVAGDPEILDFWKTDLTRALREDLEPKNITSASTVGGGLRAHSLGMLGDKNVVLLHLSGALDWGAKLVEAGFATRIELGREEDEVEVLPASLAALHFVQPADKAVDPNSNSNPDIIEGRCDEDNKEVAVAEQPPPPSPAAASPRSKCRPYTADNLQEPLWSLIKDNLAGEKFLITSTVIPLIKFYIVRVSTMQNEYIALKDMINEYMASTGAGARHEEPQLGDIVIAGLSRKYTSAPEDYIRAELISISDYGWVQVRNIDNGETVVVPATSIYEITDKIFKMPKLGYIVRLSSVDDSPPLILEAEFDRLMQKLKRDGPFSVQVLNSTSFSNGGYEARVIMRSYTDRKALHEKINQLSRWEWKYLFDECSCRTDDLIIQRSGSRPGMDIPLPNLPAHVDFPAKVLRIDQCTGEEGEEEDAGLLDLEKAKEKLLTNGPIIVLEPQTPYILRMRAVLENQLEKYTELVTASNYFPTFGEVLLIKPPEGQPGAGKWHRALKYYLHSFVFYAVDTAVLHNATGGGYQFRQVPKDFVNVPFLLVDAQCASFQNSDIHRQAFRNVFQPGAEVFVNLAEEAAVDDYGGGGDGGDGLVKINSYDFDQMVRKLTIESMKQGTQPVPAVEPPEATGSTGHVDSY